MHRTARTIAAALFVASGLFGTGAAATTAPSTAPLILKQRVLVGSAGVHLSDLFANVPPEKDGRIADAPAPGDRMVLGARQLFYYAKSFGLTWRPRDANVYAEIVRDSVPVPVELVREALVDALTREHLGDDFDVQLFNRDLPLFVAAGERPDLVVRNLAYDARSGRFDAGVGVVGDGSAPIVVTGRVEAMVNVPALRNHAMPGDVITDADIQWIRVEARRAGPNTVNRLEDIVGQTPRRPLTAGHAVRVTDLRPNFVIRKGDLVTIILKAGTMTLTARAEALEKGAVGGIIRVRNNQSRKVLETRVLAADTVTVTAAQLASVN